MSDFMMLFTTVQMAMRGRVVKLPLLSNDSKYENCQVSLQQSMCYTIHVFGPELFAS